MNEWNSPTYDEKGRVDLRSEWYAEYNNYAAGVNQPPRIYWIGMVLSAIWLMGYLIIYPSIPMGTSHGYWQGIGIPGSCQPWTAICEMQKAEDDLNEVRANYLKRVQQDSAAELLDDQGIKEFIFRAGKVRFEDNCAGCHGHNGVGVANPPEIASALNDNIWMHGGDVKAIELSIQNMAVHPFGIVHRLDGSSAKVLAIYVHGLGHH